MRVLLLVTSPKSTADYVVRMKSLGITYVVSTLPLKPYEGRGEDKGKFSQQYLDEIAAYVYAKYAEDIDLIQLFLDRKDWHMSSGIHGIQWHMARNGYQIAAVNAYFKGYEATLEHEMWHSFDNIVQIYLGISLAGVLGVKNFDDDVVHRRGPNRKYLNWYGDLYPTVLPFVMQATAKRREIMKLKNLLSRLMAELRAAQVAQKPDEIIEEPKEEPMPVPNGKILYNVAKGCIGKDMSDRAPNQLGCADSVNNIYELAFGSEIGGGVSTTALDKALKKHKGFLAINKPEPYAIIMCATGESTKGAKNGHVGIIGEKLGPDDTLYVMSNDSFKGTWEANYTVGSWKKYFGTKLGFPVKYYRVV